MSKKYKVSIWKVEHLPTKKRNPYRLRWTVGGESFSEVFATFTMADSFRSDLKSAQNRGEPFDLKSGRPESMVDQDDEEETIISCFDAFVQYAKHKKSKAAKYRRDIADVLRDIMCILLPQQESRPKEDDLREALRRFAFNPTKGDRADFDVKDVLTWVAEVSPPLDILQDMKSLRSLLDGLTRLLNGKQASPKYFAKRRRTLYNLLKWAVVEEHFDTNPLDSPKLKWEQDEALKIDDIVDPREVGNMRQVEAMLTALSYIGATQGLRFIAFFGCMYYAMARPEEVTGLREEQCELPVIKDDAVESDVNEWGILYLEEASPDVGRDWTLDGSVHETRGLKQRGKGAVRPVPIPPRLVWLLHRHIKVFGVAPDGRLFRSMRRSHKGTKDNRIGNSTYNKVWRQARELAMSPRDRRTPLLRRPYSCRHSGISKRRYAGVPAQQVAAWAGHSVEVQDRIYAKVLEGYDDRWRKQIDEFMAMEETDT